MHMLCRKINYCEICCRAFGAIVFGAMSVGKASEFAPDYGKAKAAAAKIFALLDKQPTIDSFCTDGEKPVSTLLWNTNTNRKS